MKKFVLFYPLIIISLILSTLASIAESNSQIRLSGNYSIIWSKNFTSNIQKVNNAMDLTGDQINDVIVILSDSSSTEVKTYKGIDGSLLWNRTFSTSTTQEKISIIKLGDIDGDNIKDFILYTGLYLYTLSGKSGNLIWQLGQYESDRIHFEDFNGDGIVDVLIRNLSDISVLNGKNGSRIFYRGVYQDYNIYIVDDLDGDGGKDILIREQYAQYDIKISAISGSGGTLWTQRRTLQRADDWISLQKVGFGGDIDGDGKKDLILEFISKITSFPQNYYYECRLDVKKGNTGGNFWTETVTSYSWCGIPANFIGDLNGDGKDEVIRYGDGNIFIRTQNSTLWTYYYGIDYYISQIHPIKDIDGDRYNDLVLESYNPYDGFYNTQKLTILKGSTGEILYQIDKYRYEIPYISDDSVDFNNDTYNDFIVKSITNHSYKAITGFHFTTLWDKTFEIEEGNWSSIDLFEDVNGNQIDDVFVEETKIFGSFGFTQRAWILEGRNSNILWTQNLENGYLGFWLWQIKDINGDGLPDVLIRHQNYDSTNNKLVGPSKFTVKIGKNGNILWEAFSDELVDAKCPQDINNNGKKDIVIFTKNELYVVEFNLVTLPPITVLRPNGGERWNAGGNYTIKWDASSEAVKFRLYYSTDNQTTWNLIKGVGNVRQYKWTIPAQDGKKPKSFVKVVGLNSSSRKVGEDVSDKPFVIEVLKLRSPNGGETLKVGSTHTITWETYALTRTVAKVILQYSTDGGRTWKRIKTYIGTNPGSHAWNVPNDPSTNCKVRVTLKDAGGATIAQDVSDRVFTIQQ